jgi:hypothetical protein
VRKYLTKTCCLSGQVQKVEQILPSFCGDVHSYWSIVEVGGVDKLSIRLVCIWYVLVRDEVDGDCRSGLGQSSCRAGRKGDAWDGQGS